MIRINNIKYPVQLPEENLPEFVAKKYKLQGVKSFRIVKQSIDARKKNDIHYVYTVDIGLDNESRALKAIKGASRVNDKRYKFPKGAPPVKPVVIAGFGPAGMMCAYMLARHGARVIVLERGQDVDTRIKDIERLKNEGALNPESNVQFGEGGAGTFSDGKLTTGVNDPRTGFVLEQFAKHGAPYEITYRAKPHIGTDKLRGMVKSFREDIIRHSGEVRFGARLSGIVTDGAGLAGVKVRDAEGEYEIETDTLVIAAGHSARDTFEMLKSSGAAMERKVFAIGARIEHKQELISRSQYGDMLRFLPAADYKLAVKTSNGRTAYTFCMCPGGEVVASASEEGGVVTNGMSRFARDGENANSALLVNVTPEDLPGDDALEGCRFQREIEKKAYELGGGNYTAPAQTVGDFLKSNGAAPEVTPTYKPGVRLCKLDDILPDFVTETMREALPVMDRKIKGFAADGALLTAPETRSSSPVRIIRDEETKQSNIAGLYPCGEGAGYAGGIMTAAIDGIKIAEAIMKRGLR
ncbi:MAG: NAD(P)/FAD-dependent oxidoreductase [Candidatus Ornithomonoglobus sp.]